MTEAASADGGRRAPVDPVGRYRSSSFWLDSLPEAALVPRPPLDGSVEADVAIVGGGYTGLWTAHALLSRQPDLRVVVVEQEICGFGASGRNGGWATFELSIRRERAAREHGRPSVTRMLREGCGAVEEIGRVAAEEGIDCDYAKGGTLTFASTPGQATRLTDRVRWEREWGFGEEDVRWLGPAELRERARPSSALGAVFTPHCAALHPGKLARGLAGAVERRGGRIFEQTRASSLQPGRVRTERGDVHAEVVLRCTEAFTTGFPGGGRELVPVYSLMVATEPLSDGAWDEIGLHRRETFDDGRHLVIYGQRTADGRFAFGGRGAPYHFGSRMDPDFERDHATHRAVEQVLRELFPQVGAARVTHRWGGAVALPRDWQASVAFDRRTGMGRAGGYVGVGVAASNLAGRTLADLVLGRDTDLVHLPWVGHVSPRWEPEPLRWLGINGARLLAPAADAAEPRSERLSHVLGGILQRLTGHGT